MLGCFRIVLIPIFLSVFGLGILQSQTNDLLYRHISAYSHLKNQSVSKLDSSDLFYNIQFYKQGKTPRVGTQIIKRRSIKKNYISFLLSLATILVLALLRFRLRVNFYTQIFNYINPKKNILLENNFVAFVLIHTVFCLLVSYLLFKFFSETFIEHSFNSYFTLLLITFSFIGLTLKYVFAFGLRYVFDSKAVTSSIIRSWIEFSYVFICIAIPTITFASIANSAMNKLLLNSAISAFVIMYIFSSLKLMYKEMHIIKNNVINSFIYFYIVEIIPILLLSKYFMTSTMF